jgi:hypothetical protein
VMLQQVGSQKEIQGSYQRDMCLLSRVMRFSIQSEASK